MAKKQKRAVRDYLIALRDPASLRDNAAITALENKLERSDDVVERVQLRQQLLDLDRPTPQRYEGAFVEHARAWADGAGISGDAFVAEGVPSDVLRRAGFQVTAAGRGRGRGRRAAGARRPRTRVSADEIRAAIPSGTFTVKDLQERSGASAAVVRRVISEQVDAGDLVRRGTDSAHAGPGRAPAVYQRA